MKFLALIITIIFASHQSHGQLFDRIIDRTKDKLSRQLESRIVERISDEITRAAMKPVDKAIDDMLRERYTRDSIEGRTASTNYNDFLAAFAIPVDLPPAYEFDMVLKSETKDYDGEKSNMDIMLTKDGSAIGITQYEDGESKIVFDMTNNIMAIYTDNHEGKKVVALPSMLSLAGSMNAREDEDEDAYKNTIRKTGKTKKIVGYKCDEWESDEEATLTKIYIAGEFPIFWKDSFSQFMKEMTPTTRRDQMPDGMVLKSETKTKKKNKKSTFEVKKVIDAPFTIDNSAYEKTSYTEEN